MIGNGTCGAAVLGFGAVLATATPAGGAEVFPTVAACAAAGEDECAEAWREARNAHAERAPQFRTAEECRAWFGAGSCETRGVYVAEGAAPLAVHTPRFAAFEAREGAPAYWVAPLEAGGQGGWLVPDDDDEDGVLERFPELEAAETAKARSDPGQH